MSEPKDAKVINESLDTVLDAQTEQDMVRAIAHLTRFKQEIVHRILFAHKEVMWEYLRRYSQAHFRPFGEFRIIVNRSGCPEIRFFTARRLHDIFNKVKTWSALRLHDLYKSYLQERWRRENYVETNNGSDPIERIGE